MRVKFCGLTRQEDVDRAVALGADMLGFIFHARSPRAVQPEQVARLRSGGLARVGVFVEQDSEAIADIMRRARLDYAQLHGAQDDDACARRIGAERIIRVFWPQRHAGLDDLLRAMRTAAPACAWYLLDAGLQGGGSGKTLNWQDLAALSRADLPRPWLLAGGLDPAGVAQALTCCRPDGLDINSGVEDAPGIKNHEKMAAVLRAMRQPVPPLGG